MQALFGRRGACQQKIEAILNGRRKMRRQSGELARGALAVPVREIQQAMHDELRGFVHQLDRIAGMDGPSSQNGRIESAQAPSRRCRIPSFHFLIIDRVLDAQSVGAQGIAGRAELGDFEENLADAVALADTHPATVQASGSEILAQRAMIQRKSLPRELVNALGGDDEDRLARTAMDLGMGVSVSCNAK